MQVLQSPLHTENTEELGKSSFIKIKCLSSLKRSSFVFLKRRFEVPESNLEPDFVNESIDGLFIVNLRGLNLSEQEHRQMEQAIQNAVMRELASINHSGNRPFPKPGDQVSRPVLMGIAPKLRISNTPQPSELG